MRTSKSKEVEKRMLIRKTINAMDKQIQKLEEQKQVYVNAGTQAKQRGLTEQLNLALSGLRMTLTQQKKVYEMKLNFEITSQMKDMSKMTSDFLGCMSLLSKEMLKLTNQKDFAKVQKQFAEAMLGVETQAAQMEDFMDETQSTFSTSSNTNSEDNKEIESLINSSASVEESLDIEIEKELEEIKKKI